MLSSEPVVFALMARHGDDIMIIFNPSVAVATLALSRQAILTAIKGPPFQGPSTCRMGAPKSCALQSREEHSMIYE